MKNKIIRIGSSFLFCLMAWNVNAQMSKIDLFNKIEGHWQGAFVKNNSFQKLNIQFYKQEEQLMNL